MKLHVDLNEPWSSCLSVAVQTDDVCLERFLARGLAARGTIVTTGRRDGETALGWRFTAITADAVVDERVCARLAAVTVSCLDLNLIAAAAETDLDLDELTAIADAVDIEDEADTCALTRMWSMT